MLHAELMGAFDGVSPSTFITTDLEGIPNIANLSRVWYIDCEHVAIANQFLNKTASNLQANPIALIKLTNPRDSRQWELSAQSIRSEQDGPLYEAVRQDLQTVSWMAGISGAVTLRSVIVLQVKSVRLCWEESRHLQPEPELFGDVLKALSSVLGLHRCSYWIRKGEDASVRLMATRGVPGAGIHPSAVDPMRRLAALVGEERRVIRLRNIRSQTRYLLTIDADADADPAIPSMPAGFLAFPVTAFDSLIGIVCCEESEPYPEAFERLEDNYLLYLSRKLGEAVLSAPSVSEPEREALFHQAVERTLLEWSKASDPFHTTLSARERQVAVNVAKGLTNAETAKTLFISPRTVSTHLERIYQKLGVSSRAALTRYIVEKGLLLEGEDAPSK